MSFTAALVYAGHDRLRYLVTADGNGSFTFTTTGAATPDLKTDSLAGPLKNLSNAFVNGYGQLAAGALTQAQSRALWLSDGPNVAAIAGNLNVPTAQCRFQKRAADAAVVSVDANVDGSGPPTVVVSATAATSIYVDFLIPGAIGA
jgi:hypothetical protein